MAASRRLTASFYGGPGFSLYHAVGRDSRVPLAPHFHDEYLIAAQIRGEEQCHVAGKLHQFSAGEVVLINPQQVHTGNASGDDIEYVSLYVDRDVVRKMAHDSGASTEAPEFTVVHTGGHDALVHELTGLLDLVRESDHALLYPSPETPPGEDVEIPGRRLESSPPAPAPGSAPLIDVESALQRVLVHAFEEFSNLRTPRQQSTNRIPHRRIARALEYMRSLEPGGAAAHANLDDLAKVAGLSKYHFLRQFNQVVGMTPGAYLRTMRLCHAARLLRTSGAPIVEVAVAAGFADHPSFSRAFARHMGMTPSDYRRLGPL